MKDPMTYVQRLQRIEAFMGLIAQFYPELTARELKYKAAEILDELEAKRCH